MSARLHVLDAQHPWPGLFPYGEDAHAFFNGRERETTDLLRLVRRDTCTIFYGQSGLGKSSLLRAGLFPALRDEAYLPVYLRLNFRDTGLGLRQQTWEIFRAALKVAGIDGRPPRDDESLWGYFHAIDVELWDSRNRLILPVLVLDQFEEIVQASEERALIERLNGFLDELADLVENRVPATVTSILEADPEAVATIDFNAQRFRCVIGFREDFLPALQERFVAHRMDTQSHLRITKMTESQALAAVQKTGGTLVDADVAQRIVSFVAGAGGQSAARTLEIEPALLSVVCFELNNRRLTEGDARISADLLAGAQDQIIAEFYQRSLADQPEAVAVFIERELLTESGYRDSCAIEDAVRRHAIPVESIQKLVERRVLRQEERFGVLRVELTHDVLAPVVRANRDKRHAAQAFEADREREAARVRRTRRTLWIGGGFGVLATVLLVVFFNLFRQAEAEKARVIEAQSTLFLSRANASLENNIPGEPVQFLARSLNLNPDNQGAIARLASFASHRRFARLMWMKEFNFPGEGVGTVTAMGDDHFVFQSSKGDLATVRLVTDRGVHSVEESCMLRIAAKGSGSNQRTLRYPDPIPAQFSGPSKITSAALDLAFNADEKGAKDKFLATCSGDRKPPKKDDKATPLDVIGVEARSGQLWANLGGELRRTDAKNESTEVLALPSEMGLARRVFTTANGESILVAAEHGAALFTRMSSKPSTYALVNRFAGSASNSEKKIEWSATFDETGALSMVSSDGGVCEMWAVAERRKLWSHACAASGHTFVPGKSWVAVFNHRTDPGANRPEGQVEIALLDARSGRTLGNLARPLAINHLAFSADATLAVVSGQDRAAMVYEMPKMARIGAVMLHEGAAVEAHFSPDQERVITAAFDGSARIWNWKVGSLVVEPLLHTGPVLFARPVLGGTHVLSVADDRILRLWRIASPPAAAKPKQQLALVTPASSRDGDVLAFIADPLSPDGMQPDGKQTKASRVMVAKVAAVPSASGAFEMTRTLYQADGSIERVVFSEKADLVAVVGREPWLAVVRVDDSKIVQRLALPGSARRVLISPGNKHVVVQFANNMLRTYEIASGRQAGIDIKLDGGLLDFGISADGQRVTAVSTAQIQVADLRTGYPLANLNPGGVVAAAVHPAESEVAFSTRGNIAIWRPRLGQQFAARGDKDQSGQSLAQRIEADDGRVKATKKLIVGMRYLGGGHALSAFSVDGDAWTWDLPSMTPGPILRHSNSIVAISASDDGRWLVTITLDGFARVWDHRSGQLMVDAVALPDAERDFFLLGRGTWALIERDKGRFETLMLGLGFIERPPSWLVPTVAALAGVELESAVATPPAESAASVAAWWLAWLNYVASRNGVQIK